MKSQAKFSFFIQTILQIFYLVSRPHLKPLPFTKVLKIKEDQVERIESQKQATTERIKSADTKRRSILDEKVEKAKADVEKAKKLSAEKREQEDKQLKALQNKIVEKKAKAEELHWKVDKYILEVKNNFYEFNNCQLSFPC